MVYIDKETAKKSAFRYLLPNGEQSPKVVFVDAIDKIPAADVVPVVRCKDCLYGSENGFICGNVHGLQYAFPNAFCSNGTKRE